MCLGEAGADTLQDDERCYLRGIAEAEFRTHAFAVRGNAEGQSWIVLEPLADAPNSLRFTICRIDPCVLVMSEDRQARRQFCSASSVEDAVAYIRHANDQAILATMNAHPASLVLQ